MQGWAPTLKKDVKVLKHVQRRGIEGELSGEKLEGMSYKEQLSALGLSPSQKWRLGSIAFCSFLRRECGEGSAGLFSRGSTGNGSKSCQGTIRWDIRKHLNAQATGQGVMA